MSSLFWVDLEMSGLDEKVHSIVEVAVVITDLNFVTQEQYHQVVFQPQEVLDKMDDWCKKTHGDSGLIAAIPNGKPLQEVETDLLALIGRHFEGNQRVILVGNSVGNDKRFLDAYMPRLAKKLHYRIIDVSSFKEIFRTKYGVEVKKGNSHRALDDIFESIGELKAYLALIDESKIPKKVDSKTDKSQTGSTSGTKPS